MADISTKRLAQLIDDGAKPELRISAIRIAGALGSRKEKALVDSLLKVLDEESAAPRLAAVEALGELGADQALPRILEMVREDEQAVEVAVRAAGRLGKRGPKAVTDLMAEANPVLKRRIAAALAHGGTDNSLKSSLQTLMDPDPSVVEAAVRELAAEARSMTEKQKRALGEQLLEILQGKGDSAPSSASEVGMIRILGELREADAEKLFWEKIDPSHPVPLRAAALESLARLEWKSTDARLQKLFDCAKERNFDIISRALMLLQKVPVKGKAGKQWEDLLTASDVAAKRLAVEKLRDVGTIGIARAMVPLLDQPHRGLQQDALHALRDSPKGRQALQESLIQAETADQAWNLARACKPMAKDLTEKQREEILKVAGGWQEEQDPRAKAMWFLLREMDEERTHQDLTDRAQGLRKKKKYEQSLSYYQMLTRDPACDPALRFEQAAVLLKLSPKDTAPVARNSDPALGQFGRLLQNTSFDLPAALGKAKWLDEEDLFYLGFHFAEESHRPAKELGKEALKMVIKKTPRSKMGKNAKSKLKTEGLSEK